MALIWPRTIPHDVLQNPLRAAEIAVYDALRKALDDTWWVFYSSPWLGVTATGAEKDGEADFIIANARRGVLFVEVKGGAVSWSAETGRWTSRDRWGVTHVIKDPVHQARSSKHEMLKKLRKVRGLENRFFTVRHGVVLPDCLNPGRDLGADKPNRIFCFADRFPAYLSEWVESRFQDTSEDTGEEPLGTDGLHALRDLVARPFQLDASLGRVARAEDREIEFLTQQQFLLLESIADLPRVLVRGGAGTGKTVLAAHMAKRLATDGMRVLLLCYDAPLASRLAAQCSTSPGVVVSAFSGLCQAILREAGAVVPAGVGTLAAHQNDAMAEAAEKCCGHAAVTKYDAIIVDEGQDFKDLWWLIVESLLDPAGRRLLRVFADNNQRVYGDTGRLSRDLSLSPINLTWNLRNTKAIHSAAYAHYDGSPVVCHGPDGVAPVIIEVMDKSRVAQELASLVLSVTREHGVAPGDVTILVPSEVWIESLSRSGILAGLTTTPATQPREGLVTLDTVRRFKGLESLVTIIVVDAELAASDELAYVALSRARTRVFVIGQQRHVHAFLDGELQ